MRGELRWLKLTPEKWADRKRRWRTTPVFRIGEAKKPGPPDKLKTCPMCGAQCRLGKASGPFVKTQTTPVWRCSTCSDGRHKKGILLCEECLGRGAPVKGDVAMQMEGSAGASAPAEDARLVRTDVGEADLRRCSRCAARRQDHGQDCSGECGLSFVSTQINRSWIYTCTTCQLHLCTDRHAKEIGKTPILRATGPTATPPTESTCVS